MMADELTLVMNERRPIGTSGWVVEVVRDSIFAGKLKPGDRIVEGRLARELQVGISPVREALQQLEYLGLVTKVVNRGTRVTQLSLEEVDQIYSLRVELETLGIQFAMTHPSPPDLSILEESAQEMMRASEEGSRTKFFEWDLAFHQRLCRTARNPFLEKCLTGLITPLFAFVLIRIQQEQIPFDLLETARRHQEIVNLLKSRDAETATRSMREIMGGFHKAVLNGFYPS